MNEKSYVNENCAQIVGTVSSNLMRSHVFAGEQYYKVYVNTKKNDEISADIPVFISRKKLIRNSIEILKGIRISVIGVVRCYKVINEAGKTEKVLCVSALYIRQVDEKISDKNMITLIGFIDLKPVVKKDINDRMYATFRLTFSSRRVRGIPCIAWNANALEVADLKKGDSIKISGSFQSKTLELDLEDGTKYEMKVLKIAVFNIEAEGML